MSGPSVTELSEAGVRASPRGAGRGPGLASSARTRLPAAVTGRSAAGAGGSGASELDAGGSGCEGRAGESCPQWAPSSEVGSRRQIKPARVAISMAIHYSFGCHQIPAGSGVRCGGSQNDTKGVVVSDGSEARAAAGVQCPGYSGLGTGLSARPDRQSRQPLGRRSDQFGPANSHSRTPISDSSERH